VGISGLGCVRRFDWRLCLHLALRAHRPHLGFSAGLEHPIKLPADHVGRTAICGILLAPTQYGPDQIWASGRDPLYVLRSIQFCSLPDSLPSPSDSTLHPAGGCPRRGPGYRRRNLGKVAAEGV